MINKRILSIVLLLALSISVATAEERRHHQFHLSDISTLELNVRAGTILVEHSDSDYIDIVVLITEEDKNWLGRSVDLSAMDIEVSNVDSALQLNFDYKGVSTDWIIKVPELRKIEINAGAGTVDINMVRADLNANIGVGTIDLRLSKAAFGDMELASGVGDTSVSGAISAESRRAFVSSDVRARGTGDLTLRANVGVGSVDAALL